MPGETAALITDIGVISSIVSPVRIIITIPVIVIVRTIPGAPVACSVPPGIPVPGISKTPVPPAVPGGVMIPVRRGPPGIEEIIACPEVAVHIVPVHYIVHIGIVILQNVFVSFFFLVVDAVSFHCPHRTLSHHDHCITACQQHGQKSGCQKNECPFHDFSSFRAAEKSFPALHSCIGNASCADLFP